MSKIKEKPVVKDPKVIDKVTRMPKEVVHRGLDESAGRVRQNVQEVQGHADTPENYASDKVEDAAGDGASHAGHAVETVAKGIKNRIKTKESYEQAQEDSRSGKGGESSHQPGERPTRQPVTERSGEAAFQNKTDSQSQVSTSRQGADAQAYMGGNQRLQRTAQLRQQPQRLSWEELRSAVRKNTATAPTKAQAKTVSKGTIKTAQKSVKTGRATVRATGKSIKTAERTAKAAGKTAMKTAKVAAQMAKVAARAAIQALKIMVKALVVAVKAIIAAVKGLIAAIAAGGWVVLVVVLVIGAVAALLFSPFGIFANGGGDGTPTVSDAVQTLNGEFSERIENVKKSAGQVDQVIVTQNTDEGPAAIDNWPDILAVFAVSASMDTENPMDVIVMNEQRIDLLHQTFWKMVSIDSSISEVLPSASPRATEAIEYTFTPTVTPAPKRVLTITISTLGWEDVLDDFNFTEQQIQALKALMSASNYSMLASLVDSAAGNPATDWSGVIDVPEGGMPIPLYLQSDYPQTVCYIDGVAKSVKTSGCGATSISMVIAYLTGNTDQTPYTLFVWAYDHGYYSGDGLGHACLTKLASLYGVKGTWIANDEEQITEALHAGHPVIAHMGPGIFTSGGHYIVLRGITADGYVLVNDPGSRSRNKFAYPLSTVVKQARTSDSFMVCE